MEKKSKKGTRLSIREVKKMGVTIGNPANAIKRSRSNKSKAGTTITTTTTLLEPQYFVKGDNDLSTLAEIPKIKEILDDAVKEATKFHYQYVGWKRKLITSTAFHIWQYLRDHNLEEKYKHRISELLIYVFKRVKGFVSAGYIQRELPADYKNPDKNTANKREYLKSSTAGLPKDSGRSLEELEASSSLHRIQPEEYKSSDLEKYNRNTLISIVKHLENKIKQQPVFDATTTKNPNQKLKDIEYYQIDALKRYTHETLQKIIIYLDKKNQKTYARLLSSDLRLSQKMGEVEELKAEVARLKAKIAELEANSTVLQQPVFDATKYPNIKPTKPEVDPGYKPQQCLLCHNGIAYVEEDLKKEDPRHPYISFVHYDEAPIGIVTDEKGEAIKFKYRTCGPEKGYLSLKESLDAANEHEQQQGKAKAKLN